MSDDNLEALDNASLRKKCLEYGLPNVPITDTSRKLLIRKLRAAITGETADKKKSRRETIHVTKIPSPVETVNAQEEEAPKRPPSRINRRTIAATSVTSTVDDTTLPTTTGPVADRRRSVRSQPDFDAPVEIPVSQKRKTAILLEEEDEDDDDDEDDVILLEAAERSERQAKEIVIPISRNRRSVSLSKTGVVTTSYSQESVATPSIVNETESDSDSDFVAKYASTYDPITRPVAQTHKPDNTTYGLSQREVLVEPDRTATYRTVTVNRTSIEPEPLYKPSLPQPRYSSLGSGYSTNTSQSSTTTRRFTTGAYGPPTDLPSKYTSVYGEEGGDENESETPYLSDFARKLERLKTEPLGKGVESPRHIPIQRDTQRYQSSIRGRRSTTQQSSVADSFRDFLLALDRKYKLKRNLAIVFAVILLLFIYIVFIQ